MKHVMVVDDDRTTVCLLAMLLEMDGFRVSQATQPAAALERGRSEGVEAFVIDCNLAGQSGLDLVKEIRADEILANAVVILTSGQDLSRAATEAGADLFLLKPFPASALSSNLAELVQSSGPA
jgi:DNA-binding response OmpR family regulator